MGTWEEGDEWFGSSNCQVMSTYDRDTLSLTFGFERIFWAGTTLTKGALGSSWKALRHPSERSLLAHSRWPCFRRAQISIIGSGSPHMKIQDNVRNHVSRFKWKRHKVTLEACSTVNKVQ